MTESTKKESPIRVNIHSFFILPFVITAVSVLIFYWIWLILTHEPKTVEDYLQDVKIGSASKRWQSAFELSKILSDPDRIPDSDRFVAQMLSAFDYAEDDRDPRVKQYLIRAMGQTRMATFSETVSGCLRDDSEEVVADAVFALGIIGSETDLDRVIAMTDHRSPLVRNRAAIALGNMGFPQGIPPLQSLLKDPEPNVVWNSAVALARLGDHSGKRVLLNLLDMNYFDQFREVDSYERTEAVVVAIDAASQLNDSSLDAAIRNLAGADVNMRIRNAALNASKL
ncbi:MAG: HEAT repeat domain-containing protein [Fidelibacterota bacterium]